MFLTEQNGAQMWSKMLKENFDVKDTEKLNWVSQYAAIHEIHESMIGVGGAMHGGYAPADKWLKDRKGKAITESDIATYRRIIQTLAETDTLMDEIESIVSFEYIRKRQENESPAFLHVPLLARIRVLLLIPVMVVIWR